MLYGTYLFFLSDNEILSFHDRLRNILAQLHELHPPSAAAWGAVESVRGFGLIHTSSTVATAGDVGDPPPAGLAPSLTADEPRRSHRRAVRQEAVPQRRQRSGDRGRDGREVELGLRAQVLEERVFFSAPCFVGLVVAVPPPRLAVEDEAEVGQGVQMLERREKGIALDNSTPS